MEYNKVPCKRTPLRSQELLNKVSTSENNNTKDLKLSFVGFNLSIFVFNLSKVFSVFQKPNLTSRLILRSCTSYEWKRRGTSKISYQVRNIRYNAVIRIHKSKTSEVIFKIKFITFRSEAC